MPDNGDPKPLKEFLDRIDAWYRDNHEGFRTLFDATIANVVKCPADPTDPDGKKVYFDWRGATIDTLKNFFRDWYNDWYKTKPNDGLNSIEKFSWLTYENDYGMVFMTCGPGLEMTKDFTNLQGDQMDDTGEDGQKLINLWRTELGTRMDDFEQGPWDTFNQFFIRELRDASVRPVDAPGDNSVVVAPTDCVINMIVDDLAEETPIPVKTVTMNVKQLLAGSEYYKKFVPREEDGTTLPGGTAVSCILMPDTYHWYHAPVEGEVVESHDDVHGIYYGMRDFPELLNKGNVGYGFDYEMFDNFRRGYLVFRTTFTDPKGKEHETYVAMVTVGLNSIGSVQYEPEFKNPQKPVAVTKGQKIGNFQYGGSLNILLFEYSRFPALQLHMGQRIGTLEAPERTKGLFTGPYHTQSRRGIPFAR
ncbi:phosphatidylserine decarboxylase [Streptomyces sp. CBMA156]|uniref:phosphatidylserine decarboxylase n=1 Tax=Streptomyces sp. CBMA156 TaxID=1930280 RepID=UPI0016619482|nr:phosphatidylserine decarboxylase [Streptomyces sp. CBMA156]MBD0669628.1 phosphatidylserine decarboxylase [Streptomyces sp. CBMA156]